MWQKCPICDGTGSNATVTAGNYTVTCKTCNGKGIISELTGLPPSGIETFASPKYRNQDGMSIMETCPHRRIEEIQGGKIEKCMDCGKEFGG